MSSRKLFSIVLSLGLFTAAASQSTDEIIQKHITATGGYDKWKQLQTLTMKGKMFFRGMELNIHATKANEKGYLLDVNNGKDTGYDLITKEEGWQYLPFLQQKAPSKTSENELNQLKDGLDIQGVFIDYAKKGHNITLLGKEKINDNDCYKLDVHLKSGKHQIIYVNATTFYIDRVVDFWKSKEEKMIEIVLNYSNYKPVSGIVFPFTIIGPLSTYKYESMEVNTPLPETVFKKS